MSFYNLYKKYEGFDFASHIKNVTNENALAILEKESCDILDFLTLISPNIDNNTLEQMAVRSQRITEQHFGKTMSLFTPLYISNHCANNCIYCGFKAKNQIKRRKLQMSEIEAEAKAIEKIGIKHVVVLTGESRKESSVEYIAEAVKVIKPYFNSISVEIYSLEEDEYKTLSHAGVDGLTMFQETYNEIFFDEVHSGPKKNFRFRLEAPERAAKAGMRTVGIGALLGLYDAYFDSFFTALHADYIMRTYPSMEVSVSLPRIKNETGGYIPHTIIDDTMLVRLILAMRLFLPKVGITISTRENANLRDNLIGLGVTKISAGSKTEVGGYTMEDKTEGQFDISDDRDVQEVKKVLYEKGYQPILTDWR